MTRTLLARFAALLATLLLLPLAAPPAAADPVATSGFCVMVGVDEAPWDNWIIVWACGAAPNFTGWACSNVGLVWSCVGGNGSGNTTGGVWIETLDEIIPPPA